MGEALSQFSSFTDLMFHLSGWQLPAGGNYPVTCSCKSGGADFIIAIVSQNSNFLYNHVKPLKRYAMFTLFTTIHFS